jgi:hypothetical protein
MELRNGICLIEKLFRTPGGELLSHQVFWIPFPGILEGSELCVLLTKDQNKARRSPGCLRVTPEGAETQVACYSMDAILRSPAVSYFVFILRILLDLRSLILKHGKKVAVVRSGALRLLVTAVGEQCNMP